MDIKNAVGAILPPEYVQDSLEDTRFKEVRLDAGPGVNIIDIVFETPENLERIFRVKASRYSANVRFLTAIDKQEWIKIGP